MNILSNDFVGFHVKNKNYFTLYRTYVNKIVN